MDPLKIAVAPVFAGPLFSPAVSVVLSLGVLPAAASAVRTGERIEAKRNRQGRGGEKGRREEEGKG